MVEEVSDTVFSSSAYSAVQCHLLLSYMCGLQNGHNSASELKLFQSSLMLCLCVLTPSYKLIELNIDELNEYIIVQKSIFAWMFSSISLALQSKECKNVAKRGI